MNKDSSSIFMDAAAQWAQLDRRRRQRASRARRRREMETAAEREERLEKGRERARLRREKKKGETEDNLLRQVRTWGEAATMCKVHDEREGAETQKESPEMNTNDLMDKQPGKSAEKQSVQDDVEDIIDVVNMHEKKVEDLNNPQVPCPDLISQPPAFEYIMKYLLKPNTSSPHIAPISQAEMEASSLAAEIAEADSQIRWTSEVIFSAEQKLAQLYATERPYELAASSARILQERARAHRLLCVSRRSELLSSPRPPTVSPSFVPGAFLNPAMSQF